MGAKSNSRRRRGEVTILNRTLKHTGDGLEYSAEEEREMRAEFSMAANRRIDSDGRRSLTDLMKSETTQGWTRRKGSGES